MHPQAQEIAPKVKYEWEMFSCLAEKLKSGVEEVPQFTQNLLLEDFLLHARVLRDFFTDEPRDDDVSARHFYDDDSMWKSESNNLCVYLRDDRRRLNKKLAHLTYSRLAEEETWNFDAIRADIVEAWNKFHSLLGEEARGWLS